MSSEIVILTGAKQTGKTTLLFDWCKKHSNVFGVLTPICDGERMFYDIANGEYFKMEAAAAGDDTFAVGKYFFLKQSFQRAAGVLCSNPLCKKLLIVDEVGPLEMQQQQGFYEVLIKILRSDFLFTTIIVVRLSLVSELEKLIQHYGKTSVVKGLEDVEAYLDRIK